jgi:hypothetical protein
MDGMENPIKSKNLKNSVDDATPRTTKQLLRRKHVNNRCGRIILLQG